MKKKRILVIGNYKDAMYHPLTGVDECLEKMFPEMELYCTDNTLELLELKGGSYQGLISYLDIWNGRLSEEGADAILAFVNGGGAILVIHNGISFQNTERLKEMAGARFLTHPKREDITFLLKKHAITEGCSNFTLFEEPYQFDMVCDDKEIFMTYLYQGKEYPAGWCKQIGAGRLVFLTPGHTADMFENAAYVKLIQNSMKWLGVGNPIYFDESCDGSDRTVK